MTTFGTIYRGIVQYYLLAADVFRLNRLQWVMETSMLKTLAAKHRSTVSAMAHKHRTKIDTPHGKRTCFEARVERHGTQPLVARFGGSPLHRQVTVKTVDRQPVRMEYSHKELVARLLADTCEICEHKGEVQVHHIRRLAGLARTGQPPAGWEQAMRNRRRKTLVVCDACHDHIHAGQNPTLTT